MIDRRIPDRADRVVRPYETITGNPCVGGGVPDAPPYGAGTFVYRTGCR